MKKWKIITIIMSILLLIEFLIGFAITNWLVTADEYTFGISMIFLFPILLLGILFYDIVAFVATLIVWIIGLVKLHKYKKYNNI